MRLDHELCRCEREAIAFDPKLTPDRNIDPDSRGEGMRRVVEGRVGNTRIDFQRLVDQVREDVERAKGEGDLARAGVPRKAGLDVGVRLVPL